MSFIMNRKACVFWGHNPPPELAYVVGDRPAERRIVTWAEVMAKRRERQAERMRRMYEVAEWRAYRVWVAYFDQSLMGGWQAFIDNIRTKDYPGTWIDRDRRQLKPHLMSLFPLVPFQRCDEDERTQWNAWKMAFAKEYQRGKHDRRPRGVRYVWWNERDCPLLIAPDAVSSIRPGILRASR